MPRYTLTLCGLEVTFRTDADGARIGAAQTLLEERFKELDREGGFGKEKILTCMALSLADDYLVTKAKLDVLEGKIQELLQRQP